MDDKLMDNVQVVLNLYKRGELNNSQAFDILYGMYRTARYDHLNKSTDLTTSYFPENNRNTTWDEPFSTEQE